MKITIYNVSPPLTYGIDPSISPLLQALRALLFIQGCQEEVGGVLFCCRVQFARVQYGQSLPTFPSLQESFNPLSSTPGRCPHLPDIHYLGFPPTHAAQGRSSLWAPGSAISQPRARASTLAPVQASLMALSWIPGGVCCHRGSKNTGKLGRSSHATL